MSNNNLVIILIINCNDLIMIILKTVEELIKEDCSMIIITINIIDKKMMNMRYGKNK